MMSPGKQRLSLLFTEYINVNLCAAKYAKLSNKTSMVLLGILVLLGNRQRKTAAVKLRARAVPNTKYRIP